MNTIQQAHILLVDDNTDLLRLLEEQLRGAGYQNIRTVQNCAAAQTAFAAEMPELMILDINLPDGDGFSLFRTLRAKSLESCSICCAAASCSMGTSPLLIGLNHNTIDFSS